jgi:hypothetical protein
MTEFVRPKANPFELLKVMAERLAEVAPADTLTLLIVAALDAIAVVRNTGTPRLTPLVLSVPTIAVPAVVVEVNPVPA